MTKLLACLLVFYPLLASAADQMIPALPGMSWEYDMTQEVGEGVRISDLKPDPDGKFRARVVYRINGTKKIDDKELLEFEMHRAGQLTNTDIVAIDEHGILCFARIDQDGELTKLDPPQIMVATPLQIGTEWDFDGAIAGTNVHQHYRVTAQEDVTVPAGKFRAWKIEGEQTAPNRLRIGRWFAKGTGIVKDVTTTESEDGDLIRRIGLELRELPRIEPRPEIKPVEPSKKLTISLAPDTMGEATVNFAASTPKICARWQGHGLPERAKIRAVWIAENVTDVAPPEQTIDEAATTATAPDSHGVFTLSRPEKGWAPGDYRVEFYVDSALVDAQKLKIRSVSFFEGSH